MISSKKIIGTILFGACFLSSGFSQGVSNVVAKHSDGKVLVTYDLDTSVPAYFVELTFSRDGGITFSEPLKRVLGDANNVTSGSSKKIIWDASNEIGYFDGNMVFRVNVEARAKNMPDKIESEKFSLEVKSMEARNSKLYVNLILTPKVDDWMNIIQKTSGIINSNGVNIKPSTAIFSSSRNYKIETVTNLPIEIELIYDNYQSNLSSVPRLYVNIDVHYRVYELIFENVPVVIPNP